MVSLVIYVLCKSKNIRRITTRRNPTIAGVLGSLSLILESSFKNGKLSA